MTAIGTLRTKEDRGGKRLEGSLATLDLSLALTLRPNGRRQAPNDPDWIVSTSNRDGVEVPVGAAWTKTIKAQGREGQEYLSVTLDDPSFPRALNVAAFPAEEPGTYELTWRRRQDRAAQAA